MVYYLLTFAIGEALIQKNWKKALGIDLFGNWSTTIGTGMTHGAGIGIFSTGLLIADPKNKRKELKCGCQ